MPERVIFLIEITCLLDVNSPISLYIQLYQYLKNEIQNENIAANAKLPSQRKLAQHLNISRNTVDSAYQQLLVEGFIRSEPRRGLFVEKFQNNQFVTLRQSHSRPTNKKNQATKDVIYDFRQDSIDLELVPTTLWKKLMSSSLQKESSQLYLNGDQQGEYELRKQIADYLFQSRAVYCQPEQIIIAAGTQYLLTLLCSLLGREITYAVEEPGFHRAREVLKNEGVNVQSIPLDAQGINLHKLKASHAKIVYVTPSHQFPTGSIMPITRRMTLIEWANANESFIIEDDHDGELRYQGRPIPSMQGLDKNHRIIYLGTFSRSLFPSICVSYMVLPEPLISKYKDKFSAYKQTIPRIHQHTLAMFLEAGHFGRHINRIRTAYKRKYDTLLMCITRFMGNKVEIISSESGLHILLSPRNHMTEAELIQSAKQAHVRVYPTSVYYTTSVWKENPTILLGFGGLSLEEIEKGIIQLNKAWFNETHS